MFNSVGFRSAAAYKAVGVETRVSQASPHVLVDMLFDGLLQAIRAARGALARNDNAARSKQIGIAVRILDEGLKCGLNLEKGGELAANLYGLYDYCINRLTQANARNDDASLVEVQKLIEPVAAGWKEMGEASAPRLQAA